MLRYHLCCGCVQLAFHSVWRSRSVRYYFDGALWTSRCVPFCIVWVLVVFRSRSIPMGIDFYFTCFQSDCYPCDVRVPFRCVLLRWFPVTFPFRSVGYCFVDGWVAFAFRWGWLSVSLVFNVLLCSVITSGLLSVHAPFTLRSVVDCFRFVFVVFVYLNLIFSPTSFVHFTRFCCIRTLLSEACWLHSFTSLIFIIVLASSRLLHSLTSLVYFTRFLCCVEYYRLLHSFSLFSYALF